ncbi:hypothetical protein [Promicromonospora sp. NPDC090134]|uniref:hypothetical protein n=1 Tax=Promicromonospora sp. NPDC090134 TaxID=3364408 RepID=UPI003818F422
MPDEAVGPLFIILGIVLSGLVAQWSFRHRAVRRTGSGTAEIVVWARSGHVPGLARKKKWVKAKAGVDESGRLVWVKPAGEAVTLTLRSRESRPRDKGDLWFLDPGTPIWDAVTADGQELGIVIPQAREHWLVEKLPVGGLSVMKP